MDLDVPRAVHPAAWWGWAVGLAVAASAGTNPLLLLLALAVAGLVVAARRGSSPWARAFRLYLWLGVAVVLVRVLLHVVVGVKTGRTVVLPLPRVSLPTWAAGVELGGDVRLEGLLAAAVTGLRLAVVIACIGAANALANPKRLLRSLPAALHEVGAAVVVSVSVAPQLAESVQRVLRARQLRGDGARGLRALPAVALPVLEDTLERSLLLAAAMDSRGYGRTEPDGPAGRRAASAATLTGLLLVAVGLYGVLDASTPALLGTPALLTGLLLCGAGLWLGGRRVHTSVYRRDPWRGPEWLTLGSGVVAAAALTVVGRVDPDALSLPLSPLAPPALPVLGVAGLLVAALPALLTPPPPRPAARVAPRGAREVRARG
ncbi:energy-coupling factor transporter transmembrane protein EcfT [Phycicoccus endophyticus]|uniref:Energy-coupling factor transporter transmembrane protein EcfT n=1 Tax=Phycicoccus endophyticus TaxID=1690220 RepID=A0A7G9R5M5_9MICO|nr:energy-coupling factor transporter transmembrane protein EcfT [Phycicoccus endophyticus]QNN50900.1 energy-coupling factor transporter transmembrane protein EcfT [Phycicoccus endophyticus]